jgi:leucyl aminopeptidase
MATMGSATTQFLFSGDTLANVQADGVIVPVYQQKDADKNGFVLPQDVQGLPLAIAEQAAEEKFDGSKGKCLSVRTSGQLPYTRLVLVGVGEEKRFKPEKLRGAVQAAVLHLVGLKNVKTLAICPCAVQANIDALVDGVFEATYRSAESKKPSPEVTSVKLLNVPEDADALRLATVMAQAKSEAKDLVNMPSNIKTTQVMVDTARALASLPGVTVEVQEDVAWIAKEMPAFYAVARGSVATDPPKFIRVTYQHGTPRKKFALVGKTVIFDTGGYQVKPGDSMVTMKGDMTGGAFVLATIKALATLAVPDVSVTAYLAATPNKIDSDAFLPDSILNSTVGKKIEVRHTDAEGRLTLIDAVTMAAKDGADEIVTVATLTGAAMRAVGICVALMGNNPEIVGRVKAAADALDEPFQVLDLFDSDWENIQSKLDGADIRNTSKSGNRGAQTAAAFVLTGLPEESLPMAHLDIAGADMQEEKATGFGQKTLVKYVLDSLR